MKNPLFGQVIMFCILLNTIVLACDGVWVYDPENKSLVDALEIINEILTFIFLIDLQEEEDDCADVAGRGQKEPNAPYRGGERARASCAGGGEEGDYRW